MQGQFSEFQELLSPEEEVLIHRYKGERRFRCAVLLKFFQTEGRFPNSFDEIPQNFLANLSKSLRIEVSNIFSYDTQSGTSIRRRADIREFLGFRRPKAEDYNLLQNWLCNEIIQEPNDDRDLLAHVKKWFWDHRIESPAHGKQDRIVNTALASFEEQHFQKISTKLSNHSKETIDRLFIPNSGGEADGATTSFSLLKSDPGKPSLNSVFMELSKLEKLDNLDMPSDLFDGISLKTVHQYRSRAATESVWDMRRHPDPIWYTLAAAFCWERRQEIIDGLVELLIQIVHKIQVNSEKKVIKELVNSVREVSGKKAMLFKIAEAAIGNPNGTIREVLFPLVGEKVLYDLIKENYANSLSIQKKSKAVSEILIKAIIYEWFRRSSML